MKGNFARIVPLFLGVSVDIILWGYLSKYFTIESNQSLKFTSILLGGVLLFDFFSRVMHGVTMAFFEDVWSRNFLNFFATPLTILEYLVGLVLTGLLTSIVGLATMLLIANSMFQLSLASYGLFLVPFVLILVLFGIALGVLGCGIVLHFGPAAEWLIWPIPAFLSPIAGAFFPINILPIWLERVGQAFPLLYIFDGIRSIAIKGIFQTSDLIWAFFLSLFYLLLSCLFFVRVYRKALHTGIIAKYSAESLN